jgi:UDP-3-O-[3-hydroxymyristoyl] glucosamine N-acyltransferase
VEALQSQASAQGIAWVALDDPRLGFAEALERLYPQPTPPPGLHPSAVVDPTARLGAAVSIGPLVVISAGAVVGDGCVLHPGVVLYGDVEVGEGCELHAGAVLHPGSRLGRGCVVHSNAVIASEGFGFVPTAAGWRKMPQTGRVVLEDGVEVGCGSTIDRPAVGETRIGAGTKIDNLVHVGHGVVTGRGCALAAQVGIAGGAVLGDGVILAGQVGVANRARIGDRAIASSKSGIHGEVAAGEVVSGYPAIPNRLWLRCSAAFSKLPEMARTLRALQR